MSGRCFTEKSENTALKPSPSGQAAISPTCTGVLSWSQAFRDLEPGTYTITENDPSSAYGDLQYTYEGTSVTGAAETDRLVATVKLEKKDNVTVTFTNKYEATPVTPPDTEVQPGHSKEAISNNNGTYDLSLSVSGEVTTEGTGKVPVDVLFIVDRSGSMDDAIGGEWPNYDSTKRITAVRTAVSNLVSTISDNDSIDARYSTVAFAGLNQDGYRDFWGQYIITDYGTSVLTDWTNNGSTVTGALNSMGVTGGTNYQAGIYYGKQQLAEARDGATTVVIFLSDGIPTFRGVSEQDGNGQNDEERGHVGDNIAAAVNEIKTMSSSAFYAVGIGPDFKVGEDGYDNLVSLKDNAQASQKGVFSAQNTMDLNNAFAEIASDLTYKAYSDVTIEDTLSDKVDVVMDGNKPSGFDIVVTDEDGARVDGTATVNGNTATLTLPATDMNAQATLTATYDPASKTLTLDFPTEYLLENRWNYEVHIDIQPNEAAEQAYIDADYSYTGADGAGTADLNTGTHSGQEGFYSNSEATLTYTNPEEGRRVVKYDDPVVQLQTAQVTVTKTFENLTDDQVPASEFQITVKNGDNKTTTLSQPTGTEHTWTLNLPLGSYTFTESGYAVSEATGKLMDSVTVSGDIIANPNVPTNNSAITLGTLSVTNTAAKTVNVTNAYVDANGDLVITKTLQDMNKSMGKDATFQFKITNQDTGMVWYRYLTFNSVGTESITLTGIPAGNYTVEEMTSLGYELVNGPKVVETVVSYEQPGSASFTNKSTGGNTPGDQGLVRNNFTYVPGEGWKFTQE